MSVLNARPQSLKEEVRRLRAMVAQLQARGGRYTNPERLAWGTAVSSMMALPGLRGFWPMSAVDSSGNVQDVSGHARELTLNGDPTYNVDGLAPYIDLDGTGDYLSLADQADLDITGTESYVASGIRGLTLGGWFYFDRLGQGEGLIGKYSLSGDQRAFTLYKNSSDNLAILISSDGASTTSVTQTVTVETGRWYFTVGRYTPSSEVKLWVDDDTASKTSSIPASIFNSTSDFTVGALGGSTLLDGRIALPFLCAAALSDDIITNLFESTRHLFGV